MVGQEGVDEVALALERSAHAFCAGGPPVECRGSASAERPSMRARDHLDEEIGLQVRRGLDRLAQPRLEFVLPVVGDGVELSIRPPAGLHLSRRHLPITGQTGQRGIDLAELERLAPAEVGVVVALEVVAIARFTLEEAEEGKGYAHAATIH